MELTTIKNGSGWNSSESFVQNLNWNVPLIDPPFQKNYNWEIYDYPYWSSWMGQRWWWSLIFSFVYIVTIYTGQHLMKNRKPIKNNGILFSWNMIQAIFSISIFVRTLPELVTILSQPSGLHLTICSRDPLTMTHVFWSWVGTLLKVVDLGDTIFIVLRKQPLSFLHWYHHVSVMLYTWYTIDMTDPSHRWYMVLNAFAHSLMYTYYALRALQVKIPKGLALSITTFQIAQMFMGIGINIYSLFVKTTTGNCSRPLDNVVLGLVMYLSYFVLFLHFFHTTYLSPRPKSIKKD